ncbi:hypothetical protein FK178_07005 [Antarcticibacterium arcticum]|uniref:Uncharacterized protein n=1 Tax=Antarcticibacterium arcticum TaxID=2585771 RepID=A0A5B8YI31_9FLAO|nr:hypothetical protein [Antarcticibacterium arcticum]QED37484.1 hypothetical protein FK178_07005 [Antarcticibacterium arcticum]
MNKNDSLVFTNKTIPASIEKEVRIALSHYPELLETPIIFKFKKDIKKSFMQAQPKFSGILKNRKNRSYYIMISDKLKIEGEEFGVNELPSDVLIGWIGHELGHIMDYRDRSGFNLLIFGVRYLLSNKHIREAERAADTYAVNRGMGEYILATKDFILSHAHLSEVYKARIKRLYLSPEEIMELVEELE